jgi:hypothetical protein
VGWGLTARFYGTRLSSLLTISHPVAALAVDDAVAHRVIAEGRRSADGKRDPEVIEAGSRYEGPADWGVPLHDPERQAAARAAYRDLLAREGVKVH